MALAPAALRQRAAPQLDPQRLGRAGGWLWRCASGRASPAGDRAHYAGKPARPGGSGDYVFGPGEGVLDHRAAPGPQLPQPAGRLLQAVSAHGHPPRSGAGGRQPGWIQAALHAVRALFVPGIYAEGLGLRCGRWHLDRRSANRGPDGRTHHSHGCRAGRTGTRSGSEDPVYLSDGRNRDGRAGVRKIRRIVPLERRI
ncbi:hypothetical protein D3C75_851170 [compost metagenome]